MKLKCIEGNQVWLDGGAMFGHIPKPLWEKWIEVDEKNRIPLASRCLFIQSDSGQKILVETGVGNFFAPKLKERYRITPNDKHLLIENLQKIGLDESDIDIVVLTHLHFDHAGGLLPGYDEEEVPRLLFPNARYIVGKRHWEHTHHPGIKEKQSFIPLIQQLLEASNRLILQEEAECKALEVPHTFHFSDGHTQAMMLFETTYEKAPLVYASDLVPGMPWVHLPVTMGYDRFAERIVEEKQELLEMLVRQKGRVIFCHDSQTAAATVSMTEEGRFEPCASTL